MATQSEVVTALSDAGRLRLYARICAVPEGVAFPDLGGKQNLKDLARLVSAGLVVAREGGYHAVMDAFRNLSDEPGQKIASIPRKPAVRLRLLQEIVGRLEPERVYPETELRDILVEFSPDHAALRRYLVEGGLISRDSAEGIYWLP